jgi:hypothetical protein
VVWRHHAPPTPGRGDWGEFKTLLLRMSPDQEKILKIADIMRRRKHALFGAHARNAYVPDEPRTTADIDFLVPDPAAAKRAGEAILARIRGVTTRVLPFGMVQVLNSKGRKIADLVPTDEAITMAALGTARPKKIAALGSLRVPPREVLVAMKLDSASDERRKPSRATLDVADAQAMLEAGAIDHAALEVALSMVPPRARKLYLKLKRSRVPWE